MARPLSLSEGLRVSEALDQVHCASSSFLRKGPLVLRPEWLPRVVNLSELHLLLLAIGGDDSLDLLMAFVRMLQSDVHEALPGTG
jgi:hypothetical protein